MTLADTGYTNGEAAALLSGLVGCAPDDVCKAIVLVVQYDGRIRLGCDSSLNENAAEYIMAVVLQQRGWTVARKVSRS